MTDHIVRSTRVLLPEGEAAADICIVDGRIEAILEHGTGTSESIDDMGALVVMPGLVDAHVHINEPGRTHWEGFETATRAAAAGGVTTLVDMPLNSIPSTTSVAGFEAKLAAAQNKLYVDVGFWGGVVPGNAADLVPLHQAGVLGFKCFLAPSGVDEFENVARQDLEAALPILESIDAVLLAHSELPGPLDAAAGAWASGLDRSHATWLASRPREAENAAIALMIELCRDTGARCHIVHLCSTDALPMLQDAREEGLPLTVETCPHYLTFAAEDVPEGATQYKCAPPLREASNREVLWSALLDGDIDFVVTDHSPSPPDIKLLEEGDFSKAWGGIASLQLSLAAVWTEARRRDVEIGNLPAWLCGGPAALAGLAHRKGSVAEGYDADLVAWDPDASFVVDGEALHHRHPVTPWQGRTLFGKVARTWLGGRAVFDGEVVEGPLGATLLRNS